MNEERLKILEMLENGTINTAEANELLSTIDKPKQSTSSQETANVKVNTGVKTTGRFLKIKVDDDGEKVNITLPIAFLKSTLGSSGVNKIISKSLNNVDDDVKDSIDIDAIISCIDNDCSGEIVNIDAEGTKVLICIE
ncbi:MAG: hypothetical protein RBR48_01495 [Bacilli bacterium]|jgi:hypothetical protein|nr:hypothetical protein [Bacilli bacterium]MDD4056276.1 hypothetical protein [Bacilli bacterium]MDY0208841.1 hypothetical protein [Bacilli bacterium]